MFLDFFFIFIDPRNLKGPKTQFGYLRKRGGGEEKGSFCVSFSRNNPENFHLDVHGKQTNWSGKQFAVILDDAKRKFHLKTRRGWRRGLPPPPLGAPPWRRGYGRQSHGRPGTRVKACTKRRESKYFEKCALDLFCFLLSWEPNWGPFWSPSVL